MCNEARAEVYDVYRQLTLQPTKLPKLDLIAWPESAYPSTLQSHLMLHEGFPVTEFLEEMLRDTKTEMLIGAVDFTHMSAQSKEMAQHNASFLFDKNKKLKNVYHKNRLMPIGETLPFEFMYTYLQKLSQNISQMNPGTTPTLFTLDNGVNFTTVICFEVLFSDLIREQIGMLKKDVHFIVNMSNDSWFSESIMPVQNLFFSKWVALENNIPVVRVATTGITAVINADGTFGPQIPVNKPGILDFELMTNKIQRPTIYARGGQWITVLFCLISILWMMLVNYLCVRFKARGADVTKS
jgi:apolipoprotein N-acyltransferase